MNNQCHTQIKRQWHVYRWAQESGLFINMQQHRIFGRHIFMSTYSRQIIGKNKSNFGVACRVQIKWLNKTLKLTSKKTRWCSFMLGLGMQGKWCLISLGTCSISLFFICIYIYFANSLRKSPKTTTTVNDGNLPN